MFAEMKLAYAERESRPEMALSQEEPVTLRDRGTNKVQRSTSY